jgi:hypothetical protein
LRAGNVANFEMKRELTISGPTFSKSPIFAPSGLSKRNQQNKAHLSRKSPNSAHYIA